MPFAVAWAFTNRRMLTRILTDQAVVRVRLLNGVGNRAFSLLAQITDELSNIGLFGLDQVKAFEGAGNLFACESCCPQCYINHRLHQCRFPVFVVVKVLL
jgi:hypothetical protein